MADVAQIDPFTGIKREFVHVDDNTFAVRSTDDVQAVLDANKAEQTFNTTGYSA